MEHKEILKHEYFAAHRITHTNTHANTYHMHDALEILFIRKGSVLVTVNEETFTAQENSILLFNPTQLHSLVPHGELYDRYVLYFHAELLGTLHPDAIALLQCFYTPSSAYAPHLSLSESDADALAVLLDQILCCYEYPDTTFGKTLEQQYLIALVLIKLNRLYAAQGLFSSDSASSNDQQIVYNTILYIQKNLQNDLSLMQLAAYNYIGKNRLCRIFSQTLGISPMQYVQKIRIAKAKQLLLHHYRLEEVCNECGFHSLSHFSRTFHAQVGIPPKQFAAAALETKEAKKG